MFLFQKPEKFCLYSRSIIASGRRRNWSVTTVQHYIGYSSHYIHTFSMYRGKKGKTEIGYRDTWNSTTVTHVLLCARSTALIHGIAILLPHSSNDDEYDGYIQCKDEWCWSQLDPGIEPGSSAWEARRVTARSPRLPYCKLEVKETNNKKAQGWRRSSEHF